MTEKNILVDVPMCAFNHGKYIAAAIEGVINQKTNFGYRLVIGEDCSADDTRQIIMRYQAKYPEKIKAIFHKRNVGAFENSRILFEECKAKYLALCDGDDYWTDNNKLQKQVEFLEGNADYVMCFHQTKVIYEDDQSKSHFFNEGERAITKGTYEFEDLIADLALMHTSSVVFRNGLFGQLPHWYYSVRSGDIVLFHLIAQFGKIKAFSDCMSVYRKNKFSITNSAIGRVDSQAYIQLYENLDKHFKFKYHYKFRHLISRFYLSDAMMATEEGLIKEAKKSFRNSIANSAAVFWKNRRMALSLFVRMYTPQIYRIFKTRN